MSDWPGFSKELTPNERSAIDVGKKLHEAQSEVERLTRENEKLLDLVKGVDDGSGVVLIPINDLNATRARAESAERALEDEQKDRHRTEDEALIQAEKTALAIARAESAERALEKIERVIASRLDSTEALAAVIEIVRVALTGTPTSSQNERSTKGS